MKILYYIPTLNQEWGGVRQYAAGLLKIMAKDSSNIYYILHNTFDSIVIDIIENSANLILIKENLHTGPYFSSPFERYLLKVINVFLKLICLKKLNLTRLTRLDHICKKYHIDVVHCPYQHTPDTSTVPSICTLHDVQELHFPEFFSPEARADRAISNLKNLKKASGVIVSFQHVKNDLLKYFPFLSEKKIKVILLEMSNLWIETYIPQKVHESMKLIDGKYLIYPANTWEHKNHLRLLKAISFLKKKGTPIKLICTGHTNSYYEERILPEIKALKLENEVKFLGVLNENDLYCLYFFSHGVVIPTIYEAGSFPLVESILMGLPVICSNVTSLPETIGNTEFTFDPFNIEEMEHKIASIWDDSSFRERSINNSKSQAEKLKKIDALSVLSNFYKEIKNSI